MSFSRFWCGVILHITPSSIQIKSNSKQRLFKAYSLFFFFQHLFVFAVSFLINFFKNIFFACFCSYFSSLLNSSFISGSFSLLRSFVFLFFYSFLSFVILFSSIFLFSFYFFFSIFFFPNVSSLLFSFHRCLFFCLFQIH